MKFYVAGKKVRDIDELEEGKIYSVCGVVGVFSVVQTPNGQTGYKFESNEGILLMLHRNAIMDRILLGMVYTIKKEFKPREKTMTKLYWCIKK